MKFGKTIKIFLIDGNPISAIFAPSMTNTLTYQLLTSATATIKAIIASTRIVFIKDGEATAFLAQSA